MVPDVYSIIARSRPGLGLVGQPRQLAQIDHRTGVVCGGLRRAGVEHHQRRFAVVDEIADLGCGVGGVQRHLNRSELKATQIQGERVDALRHLHHNPVARPYTQADHRCRKAGGHLEDLPIGQGLVAGDDEFSLVIHMGQHAVQVLVDGHRANSSTIARNATTNDCLSVSGRTPDLTSTRSSAGTIQMYCPS